MNPEIESKCTVVVFENNCRNCKIELLFVFILITHYACVESDMLTS